MSQRFEVDWARCTGHLVCAELVPELIAPDDWGYPMFTGRPIPADLVRHARRARAACPALALRLRDLGAPPDTRSGASGA
jgi:ferredoxin